MSCLTCKYNSCDNKGTSLCWAGNELYATGGIECKDFKEKPQNKSLEQLREQQTAKVKPVEQTQASKEYQERLRRVDERERDLSLTGLLSELNTPNAQSFLFKPYPIPFDTGNQFFKRIYEQEVLKLKSEVKFNKHTQNVIDELLAYFMGRIDALSPKKGIYLFGEPGRGKTLIMKSFEIFCNVIESKLEASGKPFTKRRFTTESCKSIVLRVAEEKQVTSLRKLYTENLCLGDIGAEDNYKLFGILTERYDRLQSYLLITHGTGNLAPTEDRLKDRYDYRIESRFNEMFHSVYLDGVDFRKI